METGIMPFAFGDNLVRTLTDENGNPWFVAKDVCRVLGLDNNREAVSNLDDDEKITVSNPDGNPREGIPHTYTLISESGLYALVFRSRKPEARTFSKWVRAEVLPSLRKTGRYAMSGHRPKELPPEMEGIPLPEEAQGCNTSFARIYDAFTVWWETRVGRREMPGMKSLSNAVAERFRRYKSNSMMFKNCRVLSR